MEVCGRGETCQVGRGPKKLSRPDRGLDQHHQVEAETKRFYELQDGWGEYLNICSQNEKWSVLGNENEGGGPARVVSM